MATFVLVHGGWHGGWCWKKVIPFLRAAGHEVWAPTLTGLGERAHLLSPAVDLDTHVQDVLGLFDYEDLQNVILVGHSSSGMVITAVADRVPERIAHLVYLDAFIPDDGQNLFDLVPAAVREPVLAQARDEGDGWRSPPTGEEQPFGVTDPEDARWVRSKLTAHPVKAWTQAVRSSSPEAATLPRTVIKCTNLSAPARIPPSWRAGWRYRELATGHDVMVTMPRELVALLLELA